MSRQLTELLGYTLDDLAPEDMFWRLAYPDERDRAAAWMTRNLYIQKALAISAPVTPLDTTLTCKDGTLRRVEVHCSFVQGQWLFVGIDRTERDRTEQELRAAYTSVQRQAGRLRELVAELEQAEHIERHRVATILHEHLLQVLAVAKMQVSALRRSSQAEPMGKAMDSIVTLLNQCMADSRSLALEMSFPVLHTLGLSRALEALARQMKAKHGLDVALEVDIRTGSEPRDDLLKTFLFYATQELLDNVVQHARAKIAEVDVTTTVDNHLKIVVTDHGAGFNPDELAIDRGAMKKFGLFRLQQRLFLLGGRLQVDSAPGRGTRVTIEIPVPETAAS